jgi:DNA-binding NtrC family response regulator
MSDEESAEESAHEQPTTAQPKVAPASRVAETFVLTVVEGPDTGKSFRLDASRPTRTLLGKSTSCDLQLTDGAVSRRHASVELVGHRLRLRDLESTNGTVVDGMTVVEVFLNGGELIRIGSTAVQVERGEPAVTSTLPDVTQYGLTVGGSEAMRRLYPLCERLSASDLAIIIEGETGVGKEQLAQSLHAAGPRADGPFIVFDCTAVAPSLIESELFGHERGAFTGSVATHVGVFERAHRGTLLIDEVGDMPLELQPKLLRAIERLEVTRVGGQTPIAIDVRIIAATRRDLDREVQFGRFRDDLFHRLAVARIEVPPLRERKGDIELLARHFWQELGGTSDDMPRALLRSWVNYAWPGNVRELRNAVARRLALGDLGDASELGGTPRGRAVHSVGQGGDTIAAVLALDLPLADGRQRIVDEFEVRYVTRLLEMHGGDTERAAAAAGVARRQLQRLKAKAAQRRS